jgi:DNA mismatch repair protein MutL
MKEPDQIAPVRMLPERVANQIAAGEVVERPASVLKELCENALDAGADRISVEVDGAGRRLIRVVDNGHGMSPDDLLMALERHATSKVNSVDDLERVASLGFRGEAIPSIAAVSHMLLRSRMVGAETGSQVFAKGGSVREVKEVGCPVGSVIEVRSLFFNTPARKKFLKSHNTENAHLAGALIRLALARPQVAFRYVNAGRLVYDLTASQDLAVRAASLLGRDSARQMVRVEEKVGPLEIKGLCGLPGLTRSGYDQVYTFVNGRHVRDKVLLHAISQAYQGWLPGGRKPVLVLGIKLDPAQVDVNVHPAKTEVRFRIQQEVHDALAEGIRRGLQSQSTVQAKPAYQSGSGWSQSITPPLGKEHRPTRVAEPQVGWRSSESSREPLPHDPPPMPPMPQNRRLDPPMAAPVPDAGPNAAQPEEAAPVPGTASGADLLRGLFTPLSELRVLAQLKGLYILCASPNGLVIIDQHAAHERLNYDRLKQGLKKGRLPGQGLLTPVTLELSPTEAVWAEQQAEDWAGLGLELQHFGGNTWLVTAMPPFLAGRDPAPLVRDLLSELSGSGVSAATPEFAEVALRSLACRQSIKSGQNLSMAELQHLVDRLLKLPPPLTCPHGRPVVLEISARELAIRFKRGKEPGLS